MLTRTYRAGEVLFEEGEASNFAARLLSGEADIIKHNDGEAVIVGTARAGEFVGEMGVVEGMPRSATVRAVKALSVEIYPSAEFLARVSADSALALQLLVRLSERLKTVNSAFVEAMSIATSGADAAPTTLRVHAGSKRLAEMLPAAGIAMETGSFVVGRALAPGEARPGAPADLALRDTPPYRLSRSHFAVVAIDGRYAVRDLDSKLGTEVNGRGLGGMFAADRALLVPGENLVVAGGRDSPFRFRITV